MSNFGANNRFLQSNLTTNDLATETTLKDIDQILKSGTINVGVTGTPDINLTEILGTAITVNSGVVDAGTQRVSIATDDIVIVKTDFDPFNVLTELKFIDGDAVLKDNGPSGLGAQRITISNDNDPIPINLSTIITTTLEVDNGIASAGCPRICVANDNDPINMNIERIGVDGADVAISVNSGAVDSGTQRVELATGGLSESLLQANLGLNTSTVSNFNLRGFNNDIPDTTMTELSDGFSTAGQLLALPSYPIGITSFDVVSSSVADTNIGTGARTIQILYQDSIGNQSSEDVIMNGTTPVVVSGVSPNIVRFIQAQVLTAGSGNENAGRIAIYVTSGSSTTDVYEQINTGNNLSASPKIFTPEIKTVIPTYVNINMFSSSTADLFICIQVKASDSNIWSTFQVFALNGTNEGFLQLELKSLELTALKISGGVSSAGIDIRFLGMKSSASGNCRCSINMNGYFK